MDGWMAGALQRLGSLRGLRIEIHTTQTLPPISLHVGLTNELIGKYIEGL